MPHKLHSVTFDDDNIAAIHIPDCINHSLESNIQIDKEISAAEVSPTHAAMVSRDLMKSWSTYAVKSILDTLGVRGACIETGGGGMGVGLNLSKVDACGDPESGSVHRRYTIKAGLVVPKKLTVDHQGNCRIDIDSVILPDGTNAAVVASNNLALPTIVIASDRWTLGPLSIAGSLYDDLTSIEVDFGNEVQKRGTGSDLDDKYIEQRTTSPMITANGVKQEWLDSLELDGKVATHANTKLYLRKRDGSGVSAGFIADNVAEHISFTMAGPATIRSLSQGDSQKFAESSLAIDGIKDTSGNSPLIVNTATQIT